MTTRSFDDLYNNIWRPQSIAAMHVNNQIQPYLESMSERQRFAYHEEVNRLRKNAQIRKEIADEQAKLVRS